MDTGGAKKVCFVVLSTVFELKFGSDMMYEIKKRKPEPTRFTDSGNL